MLSLLHSVEINAIIIAACIPTLRPVYLVLLRRPGAENYKARSKSSTYIYSNEHERSIELKRNQSGSFRAFASDNFDTADNQVVGSMGGIRQTVDIDVSNHEKKYLDPRESAIVQANSIV